jgi:pimeloyl-ACP methyl ester carboxylesterase
MKIVKKMLIGLMALLGLLMVVYFLGPRPSKPNLIAKLKAFTQTDLQKLETQIIENERNTKGIRPDNEARIVWADSSKKQKTPYAIVYLPGFSASYFEGAPLHMNFAKRYGCNLFLSRLYGHGIETDNNLIDITPDNYLESAKEAIAIGQQIGEKVIVISTSTGGTLSIIAAAQNPDIAALIMYSPNIAIASSAATLLDKPWGLEIARMVHNGSDFHEFNHKDIDDYTRQYWTWRYRIEALVALESLISNGMIEENFNTVKCPVFVGCYYKDEENQDPVVSVAAMETMFSQLGTPTAQKQMVKFPDAKTHVIACGIRSKCYEQIENETFMFAEKVLGLTIQK